MKSLMVRLGLWLLQISGEVEKAALVAARLAAREEVRKSLSDMREAERWTGEARARLERLDALGDNLVRERDAPDG